MRVSQREDQDVASSQAARPRVRHLPRAAPAEEPEDVVESREHHILG